MPAGRAGRGWEGLSRLGTVLAGVGLSRADAAGQSTSCPPWAKPGTGAGAGHAAPGGGAADGRVGRGRGCALPVTTKLVGGRPSRAWAGAPTEGPTSCNEGAAEPGAPCTTGKQLARRGPSRVARGRTGGVPGPRPCASRVPDSRVPPVAAWVKWRRGQLRHVGDGAARGVPGEVNCVPEPW